VRGVKEAV